MTQTLQDQVRTALAARAAQLPDGAAQRITHHDYRPRTRSWRPQIAIGAVVAAGAAAAAIAVVDLGAGTPEAFAGWKASPTPAAAGQVSSAEAACQQRLAAAPAPPGGAQAALGDLTPVLTDTRGPFTFVVLANANASATCINGPSFTSASESGSPTPVTVPAGKIELMARTAEGDGQSYSFADGHTGAGVTGVTLVLADGTKVQTTVDNGWFVAWWPGTSNVTSAEVTTAAGTATQPINEPAVPPCPAGATCGSASGGGRAGGSQFGLTAAPSQH